MERTRNADDQPRFEPYLPATPPLLSGTLGARLRRLVRNRGRIKADSLRANSGVRK